jgi:hypothetical protein
MALQVIDLGTQANDGTGDDLRTAFEKVIANFEYLEGLLTAPVIAANLGSYTDQGVFKEKIDNVLYFKTIVGDSNIEVQSTDNELLIGLTDNVNFNDGNLTNVGNINLKGTITATPSSQGYFGPTSGVHVGVVNGTVYAPVGTFGLQGDVVGRNPNVGNLAQDYRPARVDGVAVKDLYSTVHSFDFGDITGQFENPIQYILSQIGIDMGTISNPSNVKINAGSIL